jgi:hypothetical protein
MTPCSQRWRLGTNSRSISADGILGTDTWNRETAAHERRSLEVSHPYSFVISTSMTEND